MTPKVDEAAPATSDEQVPDERRRRAAAMIALFLPLLTGLVLAVLFIVTVVGPRISGAVKSAQLSNNPKRLTRTFTEDQAVLAASLESTAEPSAPAPDTEFVAKPKRTAKVEAVRVSASRSSGGSVRRPRSPQTPDSAPSDGTDTSNDPPPTVPEEAEPPSWEEEEWPVTGDGFWTAPSYVNPAGGMR